MARRLTGDGSIPDVQASGSLVIGQPATPIDWEGLFAASLSQGVDPAYFLYGSLPRELALSLPVVRKGLLVYDLIGSLPLTRWRGADKIDPGTLLTQPETWCPVATTIAGTVRDLILYPHAWWMVTERETTGYPKHVQRLDPVYVHTVQVPGSEGRPWFTMATYQGREVDTRDLIRFTGPDEGVLYHGKRAILSALKLAMAADRAATTEIPEGVITSKSEYQLTPTEADSVLAEWRASRLEKRTAFLQNAEYQAIGIDASKMQLIEAREQSALELVRMLGLPNRFANATDRRGSMTYTNVIEERTDLVDISFAPYIAAIEQRLSMSDRNGSPNGQTVRFDYSHFLRSNPAERTARAQVLVPLGVMSRQEARNAEPDLTGPPPPAPEASAKPVPQAPAVGATSQPANRATQTPAETSTQSARQEPPGAHPEPVRAGSGLPWAPRDRAWSGDGARHSVRAWATSGTTVDWARYGRAFLYRDPSADPQTEGAYKLPYATVIGGQLHAVFSGVAAAAAAVNGARGGTGADTPAVRARINALYASARDAFGDPSISSPLKDDA